MLKLIVILNHELTAAQKMEAEEVLKCTQIISLPQDLKEIWMQLNPLDETYSKKVNKIAEWLKIKAVENDFVFVQGEPGACFKLVNLCINLHYKPIYASTVRDHADIIKGNVVEISKRFEHRAFVEYTFFRENEIV